MTAATLVRRIKARPSIVFDALVTAEGIGAWFGPDDLPVVSAKSDPRLGGAFEVSFRTFDGLTHVCAGEYLELVRPERAVMSWRWTSGGEADERGKTSRVEFHLRAIDIGTELTLIHADLTTDVSARSHQGGWSGALDKLTRILEAT